MSDIIATILSGNCEALVGEAIESVLGWVDSILLIDTGITDGTGDVAHRLAGDRLIAESYSWNNDFAAARNFALDAAARRGATWALTLDTDERLHFPGIESPSALKAKLATQPHIRSWLVSFRDGSYTKERFIRVSERNRGNAGDLVLESSGGNHTTNLPLAWKGRVHEFLGGAAPSERAVLAGVTVREARKTPEQLRAKLERDLVVLLEETAAHPENARWWYYLGQTYEMLGRDREAQTAFRRCATIRPQWPEQAAWACYRGANCCMRLQEPDEALELCAAGLAYQPESPELAWYAGFVCYQMGRFQQAVCWSQMAIAVGHYQGSQAGRHRISFRHLPGWYEGPYDVLRYAYRQLEEPELVEESERNFAAAKRLRESDWGNDDRPELSSTAAAARVRDSSNGALRPGRTAGTHSAAQSQQPKEVVTRAKVRVAVLGLYGSGSTATATLLSKLGVHLGRNFFAGFYEPQWLAAQLRAWWEEPLLQERATSEERVRGLRAWISDLERDG